MLHLNLFWVHRVIWSYFFFTYYTIFLTSFVEKSIFFLMIQYETFIKFQFHIIWISFNLYIPFHLFVFSCPVYLVLSVEVVECVICWETTVFGFLAFLHIFWTKDDFFWATFQGYEYSKQPWKRERVSWKQRLWKF